MKQQSPPHMTPLILISIGFSLMILVVILYFFEISPSRSMQPLKLVTGEWAPYSSETIKTKGVATAIVTRILNDMGYAVEYEFMPWSLAEEIAAAGESDDEVRGTFPYMENDKRSASFYFTENILNIEFAVFYDDKNNPEGANIRSVQDLENHQVLAIAGYEYLDQIARYVSTEIPKSKDNLEAFLELERRKAPLVVVEAVEVGEQLLEQKLPHLVARIRQAPYRQSVDHKLMLSRRNPNNLALRNSFNSQLRRFKGNKKSYLAFQEATKNLIDMDRAVSLEPYGENDLIRAYKSHARNGLVLLPRGSRALIKEWGAAFLLDQADDGFLADTLVKIKLLNGPLALAHPVLFVDGKSIRLP